MSALGKPEIFRLLLENGANVNIQNKAGASVLSYAVGRQQYTTLKLILAEPDVEVDLPNNDHVTPLMMAAYSTFRGNITGAEYVQALLDAGADPFMKSDGGKTALDAAKSTQSGQPDPARVALLEQAMAQWKLLNTTASQNLNKKFMVARRLRQGTQTTTGQRLELPQRQLPDYIIRRAEYDNLCLNLQNKLNKPGVIALARSLKIKTTSNQTKTQLCQSIASVLIK
jgi:hypothetical protein